MSDSGSEDFSLIDLIGAYICRNHPNFGRDEPEDSPTPTPSPTGEDGQAAAAPATPTAPATAPVPRQYSIPVRDVKSIFVTGTAMPLRNADEPSDDVWEIEVPSKRNPGWVYRLREGESSSSAGAASSPQPDEPAFAFTLRNLHDALNTFHLPGTPQAEPKNPVASPQYADKDIRRQKVLDAIEGKDLSDAHIDALYNVFCCEANEDETGDETPTDANNSESTSDEGIEVPSYVTGDDSQDSAALPGISPGEILPKELINTSDVGIENSDEVAGKFQNRKKYSKCVKSDGLLSYTDKVCGDENDDDLSVISPESEVSLPYLDCDGTSSYAGSSDYETEDSVSTSTYVVDSAKKPTALEQFCCAAKRLLTNCNCMAGDDTVDDATSYTGESEYDYYVTDAEVSSDDESESTSVDEVYFTPVEKFVEEKELEEDNCDNLDGKDIADLPENNDMDGNVSSKVEDLFEEKELDEASFDNLDGMSIAELAQYNDMDDNVSTATYYVAPTQKHELSTSTYAVPLPKKPGVFKKFISAASKFFKKPRKTADSPDGTYTSDDSSWDGNSWDVFSGSGEFGTGDDGEGYYKDDTSITELAAQFEEEFPDNISSSTFIYPPESCTSFGKMFRSGSAVSVTSDEFFNNCDLKSVGSLDMAFIEKLGLRAESPKKAGKKATLMKRFRRASGRFFKRKFVCGCVCSCI